MEPDCTSTDLTTAEYLACTPEIIQPVLDAILPIIAIVVLVNVLFAGIFVAKRVVRAFVSDRVI